MLKIFYLSRQLSVFCLAQFKNASNDKSQDANLLHTVKDFQIFHTNEFLQYMNSLAEMIRQGIEAANEDLKKENDARLMQEVTGF